MRISDDGPWFAAAICKANFLKQAEQFEDDYDNNNDSDYIEDASVHAVWISDWVCGGQHFCKLTVVDNIGKRRELPPAAY